MTCNRWAHHETAKCPGCPLWCVLRSLKTLPGYLLATLSPFSNRITQSCVEGKQQRRDSGKIQKAFRGENVKEHSSLYKKRILKNLHYCSLLDSLCNCLYIFRDCHVDFVESYRKWQHSPQQMRGEEREEPETQTQEELQRESSFWLPLVLDVNFPVSSNCKN